MWCCDTGDEWFHPKCIGRDDAETPPRSTTAFLCGPCLVISKCGIYCNINIWSISKEERTKLYTVYTFV